MTSELPRRGSVLLPPAPDAPAVIDPGWRPAEIRAPAPRRSQAAWLLGGVGVLLATWAGLALSVAVLDAFARSPWLGGAAVAGIGLGMVLLGVVLAREVRAWRGLRRVDRLRRLLADDGGDVAPARRAADAWLERLAERVPEADEARRAAAAAASVAELRAMLAHRLGEPLAAAVGAIGSRAALEVGAAVALCPHPALDGLVAGLRGLAVLRQVAGLYGLRPSILGSLALARRVAVTAAGTAGADLLAQQLSDHLLQRMPLVGGIAAAVPGATVAAVRLYRLARVAGLACSPLAPPRRSAADGGL